MFLYNTVKSNKLILYGTLQECFENYVRAYRYHDAFNKSLYTLVMCVVLGFLLNLMFNTLQI